MENWDLLFNELIAQIEVMDPEILASGIILSAGLLAAIVAITIIRYLIVAIGYSRMYRKAGIASWKAFIPHLTYRHCNKAECEHSQSLW